MDLQRFKQMDPHLLVSIINMKLRNDCSSLSDLARFYDINEQELCQKLATAGYRYQPEINQFRNL